MAMTHASFEALAASVAGSVSGWNTETERRYLFAVAQALPPDAVVVEIGVYGGTTLSLMALVIGPAATVIGIDDFSNDTPNDDGGEIITVRELCRRNLTRNGVFSRVQVIDRSSHEVGPVWDTPMDLCIIDGDHSTDGALADLRDFSRWVKPGGLLILDDVFSHWEVRRALELWQPTEPVGRWTIEWGWPPNDSKMIALRRAREE